MVGGLKRCGCEVIVRTYGSCFSFMFVSSKRPVPTSKLTNELRHLKQTAATEALCYCLFHDFTMFYPMSCMIHRHPISLSLWFFSEVRFGDANRREDSSGGSVDYESTTADGC